MKIAMLVSGGVDSSVALRLLKEAGHDITAFYLKIWLEDEMSFLGECPWEDDLSYIGKICREADIPLEVVPFQKEYRERIVSYTIDEVKAGRTPNPDVLCNTRVKFGAFYEYLLNRADGASFDKIASGHYAQVECLCEGTEAIPNELQSLRGSEATAAIPNDKSETAAPRSQRQCQFYLKRSPDATKDQTYFLSQLTQDQVSRALFPIGHLKKPEVRKLAEKFALPNANRADSQGLCFLGKIRFDEFVKFHLGVRKGDMIDYETGKKMGEHDGFWYYTTGQRKGIKLSGGPWYVVKKDVEKNIVYISNSYRSEQTARNTFEVSGLSWTIDEMSLRAERSNPSIGISRGIATVATLPRKDLRVKVRHGALTYPCSIVWIDDGRLSVTIDGFDTGIAEGQFAVFYDGEYCLGGGAITSGHSRGNL